jgi:hypothetical protein
MEAGAVMQSDDRRRGFLEVVAAPQSYLNLLYLLLSLPLGVLYFAFLTSGLAFGIGTLIIAVGVFVLLAVLAASRGLASLERLLAGTLLGARLDKDGGRPVVWEHPLQSLKVLLSDPGTWKGMLFLLLKLPLGIISFVLAVTVTALTLSLLLTPLAFAFIPVQFLAWRVTSAEAALALLALGLLVGILSLHLMNAVAAVWRALAGSLLRPSSQSMVAPDRIGPIIIP